MYVLNLMRDICMTIINTFQHDNVCEAYNLQFFLRWCQKGNDSSLVFEAIECSVVALNCILSTVTRYRRLIAPYWPHICGEDSQIYCYWAISRVPPTSQILYDQYKRHHQQITSMHVISQYIDIKPLINIAPTAFVKTTSVRLHWSILLYLCWPGNFPFLK